VAMSHMGVLLLIRGQMYFRITPRVKKTRHPTQQDRHPTHVDNFAKY